jgi:hypothetical protein
MKIAIKEFRVALREAGSVGYDECYRGGGIEADIHVIEITLEMTHHQHSRAHVEENDARRTC